MDICLYIKLQQTKSDLIESKDSYESLGLLILMSFRFGFVVYGVGAILIVWVEYFLIKSIIYLHNKLSGIKRVLSILVISIIAIALFRILSLIITAILVFL